MKKYSICIITLFIFVSCSSSTTFLLPEYQSTTIKDKSLSVQIDFTNLKIDNEDDVNDDLGEGNPNAQYKKFINDKLVKSLLKGSTFKKISITSEFGPDVLEKTSLKISDKKNIDINLPDGKSKNSGNEFTLFIEDIYVNSIYKTSFNAMGGGSSSKVLLHNLEYAIWDNEKSQLVSYGFLEVEAQNFFPVVTEGTWETALEDIAKEIMNSSPFQRGKANKI